MSQASADETAERGAAVADAERRRREAADLKAMITPQVVASRAMARRDPGTSCASCDKDYRATAADGADLSQQRYFKGCRWCNKAACFRCQNCRTPFGLPGEATGLHEVNEFPPDSGKMHGYCRKCHVHGFATECLWCKNRIAGSFFTIEGRGTVHGTGFDCHDKYMVRSARSRQRLYLTNTFSLPPCKLAFPPP
jgi:hypothetical protein